MGSLSQRRSGARNGARAAEAAIREELGRQAAERETQHAEGVARRKAAREAEALRPKMTADDVRGAVAVRDSIGWHRVVRVSAKSVTVQTPYSWTQRIPLAHVLEVRP
jgi:hypothetical protein